MSAVPQTRHSSAPRAVTIKLTHYPPVDWIVCYTYNAFVPHPTLMKSIERFWTEIMPRFA